MAADYRFRAVTLMRLIMRWILSSLFQEVFLDESGLQSVQQAVQEARETFPSILGRRDLAA
eukprot:124165-Rhodomonas_salina.3